MPDVPMLFMWAWSFIPWWVFLVLGAVLVAVFWQPIVAVWSALPRPVRVALAFLGSILVAIQYGRNKGQQIERDKRAADNSAAVEARERIAKRVQGMSDTDVDRELRAHKWMRDD